MKQQLDESWLRPSGILRAVAVYEDPRAIARMYDIYTRLANRFSIEFEFECVWFEFVELRILHHAKRAAAAALEADLILFSANVDSDPPEAVKSWVGDWLTQKQGKNTALAALLNQNRRTTRPAPIFLNYLRAVADKAGMCFISQLTTARPVYNRGTTEDAYCPVNALASAPA
ncbi:MAG: hypothetical protein QM813_09225 [Verrucomicrobiota bacterium]